MFYIHRKSCISPQQTFGDIDIDTLIPPNEKLLKAIEPVYDIPPGILRRMGKAVRMGVGAAMPLLDDNKVDGIIIGTSNGGKEDCLKFLNQIVEYNEGLLTPVNFVQSTPNAVAAQIGLLTHNHGYNITHLHLGLSFEYGMIDADMLLHENPSNTYLLGAVDDNSTSNYILEDKCGWYKKEDITGKELYDVNTPGSIGGEAAAMFMVNSNEKGAIAKILAVDTLHSLDVSAVKEKMKQFIKKYLPAGESIDLFLSGENGDRRLLKYFLSCEEEAGPNITIARFKHLCGEYATATAMALWLGCEILSQQSIPDHMIKQKGSSDKFQNILIYNNCKGLQHGFVLMGKG
ncbi:MAG TPA: beta-ketoacyl synthase chain length factor [Ferruginibacter sp.]|nr:beta-ketoacyl synthase chain length factor [Ferruginibacter sp.]